jgi:hypothetical protein
MSARRGESEMTRKRHGFARRVSIAAVVATLQAAGCATTPRSAPPPPPGAGDPAFEKARAECIDEAVRATAATRQQDVASKAAIGIYVRCMEGKGFNLR